MFADDLLAIIPMSIGQEHLLQETVDSVVGQISEIGLQINNEKCAAKVFCEGRQPIQPSNSIQLHGHDIEFLATDMPYLGVLFDTKLTWGNSVRRAVLRAKRAIGRANRLLLRFLTVEQRKRLLLGKIAPMFLYALTATYPLHSGDRLRLERLNRYICRIITRNFRASYSDLLAIIGTSAIAQQVLHRRILLGCKYLSGQRQLPSGTTRPVVTNPRLRPRFHEKAMTMSEPIPASSRPSSLQQIFDQWNRIPAAYASLKYPDLKRRLRLDDYYGQSRDLEQVRTAMRVL
jgi:hypothetical protein